MIRLALLLSLFALPLIEIALLIQAGQALGVGMVMLIIIGTAIAGIVIAQQQGLGVARRMFQSMSEGKAPLVPMIESFLVFAGGVLLMAPGLITDVCGALLLVPPIRHLAASAIAARMNPVEVDVTIYETRERERPDGPRRRAGGPVIEVDYERVEEPKRTGDKPNARP